MEADLLTKVVLPSALFLIMFGMGLSLRLMDFQRVLQWPKAMFVGLVGQMLLLPLIAFLIALSFNLSPEMAVGLMIIALAPGGATSNLFTYLAKGDVSLSISLTAVVSLITPFTIPFVVAFSMNYFSVESVAFTLPILQTIVQLFVITVIPVALGMLLLARWPTIAAKLEAGLKWVSTGFLLLIIALILLKNQDQLAHFFVQAGWATLLLNLSALLIGYGLAQLVKLNSAQATTIGFEVGIQNGSLALVVAGTLIGNSLMMIPAVTYSLIMLVTGALFAFWRIKKHQVD